MKYTARKIIMTVNDFRKKGYFCDVKLKVEDKEFPANKIILAAFSPFFQAMFLGGCVEARQDCISLTTIDVDVVEIILEYAYTSKIELTESTVRPVLQAAHFYQVASLEGKCRRYLEKNINAATSLGIWAIAELYCWSHLETKAAEYSLQEFSEVCWELEFLQLDADRLDAILKYDSLVVLNEKEVLDAVIRWFYFKKEDREKDLGKVFQNVRLAHIDPAYLFDRIRENKELWQSNSVRKLSEEAKLYYCLPHRRLEMHSSIFRRRNNASHVETLKLEYMMAGKQRIIIYISEDGQIFKNIPQPPLLEYRLSVCNYKLIAQTTVFPEHISEYDSDNDTWNNFGATLTPIRIHTGICEADGSWYAIGGKTLAGITSRVNRYDQCGTIRGGSEWTPLASLPQAVCKPPTVSMSGKIYVLGDFSEEKPKFVQRYSTHTNEWKVCTMLPDLVESTEVCASNRHIYVLGKLSDTEKVLCAYNVDTDEWKHCAMTTHTVVDGPVLLNGKIIVFSKNKDGDGVLEFYEPSHNSWTDLKVFRGVKPKWVKGPFLMSKSRREFSEGPTMKPRLPGRKPSCIREMAPEEII